MRLALNDALFYDRKQQCWLHFSQPLCAYSSSVASEIPHILQAISEHVQHKAHYAAGFLAYEAAAAFDTAFRVKSERSDHAFPLLWFGIYERVTRHTELTQASPRRHLQVEWQNSLSRRAYTDAIRQIKKAIEQGECYQVNYTYRLCAQLDGMNIEDCAYQFFWQMLRAQSVHKSYAAYIHLPDWIIASATPELFFRYSLSQRQIRTCSMREANAPPLMREIVARPMKGTIARGLWSKQDSSASAPTAKLM